MKFYLMRPKREDDKIIDCYGHEILYINKKPRIFNYVENCSYWFSGNINSEHYNWTEVTAQEILEIIEEMIRYRSSNYYKQLTLVNDCTEEKLKEGMKSLKKFRNLIKKETK